MTEFQLKRVVSIPDPNGQRTNQQDQCNQYQSPNKIMGFACHGSSYSTHNTTKFPAGLISQNQVFHWLRHYHQYLSPYMISPYKILTMHAPYSHTSHNCVEVSSSVRYWR